jgi:hypothetical protein
MLCQSDFVSSRRVQQSPCLQCEESPRMECSLCLYGAFYAGRLVVVNKAFSQSCSPFSDEGSRCEHPNVSKRPFLRCSQDTFVLLHRVHCLFITTYSRRHELNHTPESLHAGPANLSPNRSQGGSGYCSILRPLAPGPSLPMDFTDVG